MRTNDQGSRPENNQSSSKISRLLWLGVLGGACILAIQSFSGHAVVETPLAPAPMTGATLTALHAAIPARIEEPTPSF